MPPDPELLRCRSLLDCRHHHQAVDLYPNEMKVYYEDNKFICYKIEQNMYHQYDFAIDYRYNQNKMQDETAEDTQDETQQQSEATNETQQQSDASGKQEAGK